MHPDLGGGFGPGFKVEKGYDFVGDNATIPGAFSSATARLHPSRHCQSVALALHTASYPEAWHCKPDCM